MLSEALQYLVGLGQKAKQVEFHQHELLPDQVFVRHGDELDVHPAPPAHRAAKLVGFHDFVQAVKDVVMTSAGEVYVSGDRVFAFLDRRDRRDHVQVPLQYTTRFTTAAQLVQGRAFEPKDAVRFLRYDLHGGNVEHILQKLRRIDFQRTSSGRSDVNHGRESLGRSVEASVQQAEDIPEQFELEVPVWSNPGFSRKSVRIQIGLILDLEAQKVVLRTLADELARVTNLALEAIRGDLVEALEGVPVFVGAP